MTGATADRTVRAAVFDAPGAPEVLRVAAIAAPLPGPTEVALSVAASALNPVDAKTRAGRGFAALLGAPPHRTGWDVAGHVSALGLGVVRFAVGEQVCGLVRFPSPAGTCAESVTAPSRHLAPVPAGMPLEEAAALPLAGLTAWQALVELAALAPGQRLLVRGGAGGVGHLAVQLGRWRGCEVVATASPPAHDFVRRLGADRVLGHDADLADEPFDVVLDPFGGAHAARLLPNVRPGGTLVSLGGLSDDVLARAVASQVRAVFLLVEPDRHGLERLLELCARGVLRVHVERVHPLEDVVAAHRALEAGGRRGKLVVAVGGSAS